MTDGDEKPPPVGPVAVLAGEARDVRRSARREGSPYPKADLLPRAIARLADVVVALALSAIPSEAGIVAGFLYLLVADALFNGQGVGKRIGGIKVVHVPTRCSANVVQSVIRNSPFALAFVFYAMPLAGWFLLLVVGLPLIAFEGYMVYSDHLGIRIGDVFADTQVIDTKVIAGNLSAVDNRASASLAPSLGAHVQRRTLRASLRSPPRICTVLGGLREIGLNRSIQPDS